MIDLTSGTISRLRRGNYDISRLNGAATVYDLRIRRILLYSFVSNSNFALSRIAPGFAGIMAPFGGSLLDLKSSHICSMVTHSTPSLVLMYSIILRQIR